MLADNFGVSWLDIDLPFPCEIHHCFPRAQPNASRFRVLAHTAEPGPLRWPAAEVQAHHGHFDLILTPDESLLHLPNAEFMIFGDAWTTAAPAKKDFGISFLWSAGIAAPWDGYAMRQELWAARHDIAIPKRFWYSSRRPPKTIEPGDEMYAAEGKDALFESMFSVIVENMTETNYFTEKILDAFQTWTVPVYFGCPNIARYFDERGIIVFDSREDFLAKVNTLTPDDYWRRLPYLEENRRRSMAWCHPKQRMRDSIITRHAALNQLAA